MASSTLAWTLQTTPSPNHGWKSVTRGEGLFVAVSGTDVSPRDQKVMTSTDGITWTPRNTPLNLTWIDVTYGANKFVAISTSISQTNKLMTSNDGMTGWTARPTPGIDCQWTSVVYGHDETGAGVFVAVADISSGGTSLDKVMTSEDGVTGWTLRQTPSSSLSSGWISITYGNGTFVAVAPDADVGGAAMFSRDGGKTWTMSPSLESRSWTSVTYGGGMFVAVARVSEYAATSVDNGVTWTDRQLPATLSLSSVAYGERKGLFVAVPYTSSGIKKAVITTNGGETWAFLELPDPDNSLWTSITYGNNKFVAVSGSSGQQVMTLDIPPLPQNPNKRVELSGWVMIFLCFVAVGLAAIAYMYLMG